MARSLLAIGWSSALMGAALVIPVAVERLETGRWTGLGIGVVVAGLSLVICGATAILTGFRRPRASGMPSSVRAAVAANILVVAFFALELSDRLVRRDGNIIYWTTFLFPPALAVFCGLIAARPWAWWIYRGAAGFAVLWFLGFVAAIPFADLQSDGMPVPWYGRIYMICVSLVFAGVLAGAFWSLGRPETRSYFGFDRTKGSKAVTVAP